MPQSNNFSLSRVQKYALPLSCVANAREIPISLSFLTRRECVRNCNFTGARDEFCSIALNYREKKGTQSEMYFFLFFKLFVDICWCVCVLGECLFVGDETRLEFSHLFSEIMQTILSVNFSLTYPYLFMHVLIWMRVSV